MCNIGPVFWCFFMVNETNHSDQSEPSKIEELKKSLYSRRGGQEGSHLHPLSPNEPPEVPGDWQRDEGQFQSRKARYKFLTLTSESPAVKIFFAFSVIFFLLAAVFAGVSFFGGGGAVSVENVSIGVAGPAVIGAGEPLPLEIIVSNSNNVALEAADLKISYPEGSRRVGNVSEELLRENFDLDGVKAGGQVRRKTSVVLFGEEGVKKIITISFEYRVTGSNAIFYKERPYEVTISASPVAFDISIPKEANANQEFDINVTVSSNSTTPLDDLLFEAQSGFGFKIIGSSPRALNGGGLWRIGDLAPGGKWSVRIRAKLDGQEGDERVITFVVGPAGGESGRTIKTELLSLQKPVVIRKPFIGLDLILNDDSGAEVIIDGLGAVRGELSWVNNTPDRVVDLELEVSFSGGAFDRESASAERGSYRESGGTIFWNKNTLPALAAALPGDSGSVRFRFGTLPASSLVSAGLRNQEMEVSAIVRGRRIVSGGAESVTTVINKKIKLSSRLSVIGRVSRSVGPFQNVGPVPPKAGGETSYTISWSVTNSLNTAADVKVTAALPSYVRWLGMVSPPAERLSYDEGRRQVAWDLGEVLPGAGFSAAPREVFFQVYFLADVSHVGISPEIVGEATVSGRDRFTGGRLESSFRALTTAFENDPAYRLGDGTVLP